MCGIRPFFTAIRRFPYVLLTSIVATFIAINAATIEVLFLLHPTGK